MRIYAYPTIILAALSLSASAATLATYDELSATAEDFQALHFMNAPTKVQALRDSPKEMESSINEILSPRAYNAKKSSQLVLTAEETRYLSMQQERAPLNAALNIAERRARAAFNVNDPLTLARSREIWLADTATYFADETADFTQIYFDLNKRSYTEAAERIAQVKGELAGAASFDVVLQKYTDDTNAATSKGQMKDMVISRIDPIIGRLIFKKLEVGQISDVIPSRAGLHIIRLDRKSPRAKKPYDEVKKLILEKMLEDAAKAARLAVLESLKLDKIKLNMEVIIGDRAATSAAQDEKIRAIHKEMGMPVSDPLPTSPQKATP
jgi:parvulin-like peptidyl-prolyl isomerase